MHSSLFCSAVSDEEKHIYNVDTCSLLVFIEYLFLVVTTFLLVFVAFKVVGKQFQLLSVIREVLLKEKDQYS